MVSRDRCREIVACLAPLELVIAYLRVQGLYDAEIGEMLGLSRVAVTNHMLAAQARIASALPELAGTLAGRWRLRGLMRQRAASDWHRVRAAPIRKAGAL
jgi:hypothetical protein